MSDLDALLTALAVPAEFAKYDDLDDANILVQLDAWKAAAVSVTSRLKDMLLLADEHNESSSKLADRPVEERARITATASSFVFDDIWTTDSSRLHCMEILDACDATPAVVLEVLTSIVKPVFQRNPHPQLSIETGRKLARPAGGAGARMDSYDVQDWKAHPGVVCALRWCARTCSTGTWDRAWHLLIPPMMTLLDDYDVPCKLAGLSVVNELIERVPPGLLARTGVDGLLYQSLQTPFTNLRSPGSAALIQVTIQTTLALISRTTEPGSEARASRLFSLLGEEMIGVVWTYGNDAPEVIKVTYEILPEVLSVIGIGSARYLKVIIPQLLHPLQPAPPGLEKQPGLIDLQIPALRALRTLIDVCAIRMHRWKGTILGSLGKCWTEVLDSEPRSGNDLLKAELKVTCKTLAAACPSIVGQEFVQLAQLDPMFASLVN